MKKQLTIFLVIAMLVSAISGCTTGSTGSPENEEGFGDVEIWYYWETPGHQAALDDLIGKYNATNPGTTVVAKYVPFADFKKQLSLGASADTLPDVVIIDSPDHASYATMGIFEDITDKFDVSLYFDGPVASCTLDGRLYGIPFGSNCLSLYYNVDMLSDAGVTPPTTWDELREVSKKLTKDNVYGIALSSVQNEEGTFNFMPWVWSTGATSFEIGTEKGIRALDFIGGLVKDGSMPKEAINWTQGDVMNQFISGNLAMMVNGPWQVPGMRENAPDLNWDVALIPKDAQFASVLGGENYAVIAGGNVDGALSFLEFASEPDNTKAMMSAMGYIAARSDIANGQFADDPIMQKFVDQLQYAQPRGPHAEWPGISDAISLAFNEVITGSSSAEDAGKKAQATIDAIVK